MPITYFISPFRPPVWQGESTLIVDVEKYLEVLSSKWNTAKIVVNPASETYVASWEIPTQGNNALIGGIQVGQQIISCSGSPEEVAEFAFWHREHVSPVHALFLFDESLAVDIELSSSTTFDAIVNGLSGK